VKSKVIEEMQKKELQVLGSQATEFHEKMLDKERDVIDLKWLLYKHWKVAGFCPYLPEISER